MTKTRTCLRVVVALIAIAPARAGDTAEMQYARSCIGQSGQPQHNMGCIELDFDRDGDTDMDDFGEYQRRGFCLTLPVEPPPVVTTQPTSRPVSCPCVNYGSPCGAW